MQASDCSAGADLERQEGSLGRAIDRVEETGEGVAGDGLLNVLVGYGMSCEGVQVAGNAAGGWL